MPSAYNSITVSANTAIQASGAGILHTIVFNAPAATAVQVFDNASTNSGKLIANLASAGTGAPFYLQYDAEYNNGLFVVTAQSVTLTWV